MAQRVQPDQPARFLSHVVVGLTVGTLVAMKAGIGAVLATACLTATAHEALDAPLAGALSDLGM